MIRKKHTQGFLFPSTTLYTRVSHFFQTKLDLFVGTLINQIDRMSSVLHRVGPACLDPNCCIGEELISRTGADLEGLSFWEYVYSLTMALL